MVVEEVPFFYLNIVSKEHGQFYNCCLPSKPSEHDSSAEEADTYRSVPHFTGTPGGGGRGGGGECVMGVKQWSAPCFINQVEAL